MKTSLKFNLIAILSGKKKHKDIYWFVLPIILSMVLGSCKKDAGGTASDFPVNQTFAGELMAKGIPADVAQFFAAAKMEISKPNDSTCIYLQTFPNKATREITLTVNPNKQYTPTSEEISNVIPGSSPVYDFKFSSSVQIDGTTRKKMSYFVPKSGLTKREGLFQDAGGNDGIGITITEYGKAGADLTIGSLIDYAKESGINTGPLGSIYALASALSSVTGALDLSRQNSTWLAELDALENCAANPTNQIAMNDPNYSAAAKARVQAARSELKEVNSVRFLNIMTETGSGLTPATAVAGVGLKQGFLWSEQTMNDYSENTIMREVRLGVVSCGDAVIPPGSFEGNIDVVWDCTTTTPTQVDHEVWHTVTKVTWVFDPSIKTYFSQGNFTFEYTFTSTSNGITCTNKKFAAGSIENTGSLVVVNDPAIQNMLGYGYFAAGEINTNVAATYSCAGTSVQEQRTIGWLPPIKAFRGTGGSYEGEIINPSCEGSSSSGTEKVKWFFSVPPTK
jgi:hypothetical protein